MHQIERSKAAIRECLRECDEPAGYKDRIPDTAFDEEGEVDAKDILCTLCSHLESYDVSPWRVIDAELLVIGTTTRRVRT